MGLLLTFLWKILWILWLCTYPDAAAVRATVPEYRSRIQSNPV
jgi:hypothetical protein